MRLVDWANGETSPIAGEYLVRYEPAEMLTDGSGYKPGMVLITSPDYKKAKVFPDAIAVLECWRQSHGTRPDGKPNRPLTAYTIESIPLDDLR